MKSRSSDAASRTAVDRVLARVNRAYNDSPVAPAPTPRTPDRKVLFLDEADRFVGEVRGFERPEDRVRAMKELARRTESGEVLASHNAAAVLNGYRREVGSWRRIRRALLEY